MRCDVNLSLRPVGTKEFGTRTETKNINSLSNIVKAMNREIERQEDILESGGKIVQATMRYDANTDEIYPMRTKENSDDYRYFPDPDILRFYIEPEFVEKTKSSLPELPSAKLRRYIDEFKLPETTARDIYKYRRVSEFLDKAVAMGASVKNTANMIIGGIYKTLETEEDKENFDIKTSPEQLSELIRLIDEKKINKNKGQEALAKMLDTGKAVSEFIKAEDTQGMSDDELRAICEAAVDANPDAVSNIRAGKGKAINVIFGYIMRETRGKADMGKVNKIINELIG